MDLENQKRVKDLSDQFGAENIVVILGASDPESAGLACETVSKGDPTFAGVLTNANLGLACYHIFEKEITSLIDPEIYQQELAMMEMVIDIENVAKEVSTYRNQFSKYKI